MRLASFFMIAILLMAVSCGSGDDDFTDEHTAQMTIENGAQVLLQLVSGAAARFPAGSYVEESVVVLLSDQASSSDGDPVYFPTFTQTTDDMVAALVVNTPLNREIQQDIEVTFAMRPEYFALNGTQLGEEFVVYRYDFDNLRWNRWGTVTATFDDTITGDLTYELASATLPTTGLRGFVGAVALFHGHSPDNLGPAEQTTVSGTVTDVNATPVNGADVGIYVAIGTALYPVEIPGGTIPSNLPDPLNNNALIDVANTVYTASNGSFTINIPENLIGQRVRLRAGHEHVDFLFGDKFDLLPPGDDAGLINDIEELTIQYGENFIEHAPLVMGAD